jgi:integrase
MVRVRYRLSARTVERVREPGVLLDGNGLRLRVTIRGEGEDKRILKRWLLRVMVDGKDKEVGLGAYPGVSLEQARAGAEESRQAAKRGESLGSLRASSVTFRQAFEKVWEAKQETLSNKKHKAQWEATMRDYVFPQIGDKDVADIRAGDIVDVLRPIWTTKPETARRVLQRMEFVFKAAIRREWRDRASPTIGVREELGSMRKMAQHFRALPYAELPAFYAKLKSLPPTSTRLCLMWVVLTACRSGEARHARLEEIPDEGGNSISGRWVIPAERTKMRRPHNVPLSGAARDVLEKAKELQKPRNCSLIFPGPLKCEALSDMSMTKTLRDMGLAERTTVHGFRSSFRTWAAEVAKARPEVAEAALGHAIKDKVEAAYRRADYFDERRKLMAAWADYVQLPAKRK